VTIRYTGARVKRVEDPRLLRGQGRYVDDITLPRMLHVAFVRSPHAHAKIVTIDPDAAAALPGVVAVITKRDLGGVGALAPRLADSGFTPSQWPALADGRVNFAGEAVAAVVAETAYLAADARELVGVEYEPLPAATSLDRDRVVFRRSDRCGDVEAAFADAAITVEATFSHDRCAASPM